MSPCSWLTMQEAADYLKVHRDTIKRYIRLGKLKAHKPGGRLVRICRSDLENLGAPNESANDC